MEDVSGFMDSVRCMLFNSNIFFQEPQQDESERGWKWKHPLVILHWRSGWQCRVTV